MAILTQSGRVAMARSVKAQEIFLAWGTGSDEWGLTPPTEGLITSTALVNEVGRRICESVEFCVADDQGAIITPTGRFTASLTPTNLLHFEVLFDFTDGVGYNIREFGLFTNTIVDSSLPEGQKYFTPDQLTDAGSLLCIERCAPIYRQAMTREIENFVIEF